jgi:type I restriction enzyme S subunit
MGREMATSQDFANYVCGPRIHNHFLRHLFLFMQPEWQRFMAGSTLNTIYMPVFENLRIPLPSAVREQEAVATVLSDMDAGIAAIKNKVTKAQQVKQGMMQELLTGRTRLA